MQKVDSIWMAIHILAHTIYRVTQKFPHDLFFIILVQERQEESYYLYVLECPMD